MGMKKAEKVVKADSLRAELANVSSVILSTFQGITVEQDTQLRRSVERVGGHYEVVKNTIAERAGTGTPAESLLKNLSGTNSIAYTTADPVALAKVLTKVAKDVPGWLGRGPRGFDRGNPASGAIAEQGRADQQGDVPAQRAGTAPGFRDGGSTAQPGGGDERSSEGQQVLGRRRGTACPGGEIGIRILTFFTEDRKTRWQAKWNRYWTRSR